MKEAAALVVLAASLGAAIARPRLAPEWAVAAGGAGLLLLAGVVTGTHARTEVRQLGPTVGFLAALLVLAEGCRRAGLFDALGEMVARGARDSSRRLLAMVFVAATATTAVLSLDATVVLLTPIVLVTAARLRTSSRPPVLACAHLANSASLLLPVSNLTNLLAFQATGLTFMRFGALMAMPWALALAVEWVVLSRAFRSELRRPAAATDRATPAARAPRFALAVLVLTLGGFALSSPLGVAPVWIAAAGALLLVVHERIGIRALAAAAQPGFLVFVLALGIVVRAAGDHGLSAAVDGLIPHGSGLVALLALAGLSALMANVVNNLPATLILLPLVAHEGAGPVLAMLIGVGVGPNLTPVGSLATLLWRRVLRAHGERTSTAEFIRLGLMTVPPALALCTVALWLALRLT